MKKEYKLPLSSLLRAIDNHDVNWLARQPDDVRTEFVPLTAMRWATCVQAVKAGYMLWVINRRVNRYLFSPGLAHHPDLMFRLLASCGLQDGVLQRTWIAGPKQSGNGDLLLDLLAEQHPTATDAELRLLLTLHSRDDIATLAEDCGRPKDKVKECLKAYDKLDR